MHYAMGVCVSRTDFLHSMTQDFLRPEYTHSHFLYIGNLVQETSSKMQPQPHHLQQRAKIYCRLLDIIRDVYPQAEAYFFGSIAQTVSTLHSDMDICVLPTGAQDENTPDCEQVDQIDVILHIRNAIRKRAVRTAFAITKCRVPIVKFTGDKFLPAFDIGLQFNGVRNSALIRAYVDSNWSILQPLLRVINRWGKAVGINDSPRGWLSSYALTLMLLHYLLSSDTIAHVPTESFRTNPSAAFDTHPDHCEAPTLHATMEPLARCLSGFLVYYGYHWDARNTVHLRPDRASAIPKASKGWGNHAFTIEDPLLITFNPAQQVTAERWEIVRSEFRLAAHALRSKSTAESFFATGTPTPAGSKCTHR